jgi:hypothetical protein
MEHHHPPEQKGGGGVPICCSVAIHRDCWAFSLTEHQNTRIGGKRVLGERERSGNKDMHGAFWRFFKTGVSAVPGSLERGFLQLFQCVTAEHHPRGGG